MSFQIELQNFFQIIDISMQHSATPTAGTTVLQTNMFNDQNTKYMSNVYGVTYQLAKTFMSLNGTADRDSYEKLNNLFNQVSFTVMNNNS